MTTKKTATTVSSKEDLTIPQSHLLPDNHRYQATLRSMAGCHLRTLLRRRGPVPGYLAIAGIPRIAGAISEQRLAADGGNARPPTRRAGGRTGLECRLDGDGDELRGLRVDGDVPAEQHPADDLPGMPGRVLWVSGHVSPSS
jgi:hypothetical protein